MTVSDSWVEHGRELVDKLRSASSATNLSAFLGGADVPGLTTKTAPSSRRPSVPTSVEGKG